MHRCEWYRSSVVDAHDMTQVQRESDQCTLCNRALAGFRPELFKDAGPLQLSVPLVGIAGDFTFLGGTDADDITLVVSTRKPDVLLPLVVRALERAITWGKYVKVRCRSTSLLDHLLLHLRQ